MANRGVLPGKQAEVGTLSSSVQEVVFATESRRDSRVAVFSARQSAAKTEVARARENDWGVETSLGSYFLGDISIVVSPKPSTDGLKSRPSLLLHKHNPLQL